ncbi:MAG: NIL domain-containing protein [Fischerella sp. CENA71]|nr:NIL domain-containing protein [Fischerella sp. CENA71]
MASHNTLTNKRIRIRIPKDYRQEPVISRLVSDYGLTVNISAAILGANAIGDGWFDLELKGTSEQIDSGLNYLKELELEIWEDSNIGNW